MVTALDAADMTFVVVVFVDMAVIWDADVGLCRRIWELMTLRFLDEGKLRTPYRRLIYTTMETLVPSSIYGGGYRKCSGLARYMSALTKH